MSRAQRLLDLIQVFRRHRRPVSGLALADELGISLRTLYRDIATLKAQGAHIEGEPGVGYVLRPGFMLPPLMFSEEEIEALVLGSEWVAERADDHLGKAARNALAKIGAVLPDDLKERLDTSGLLIGPGDAIAAGDAKLPTIRDAIRRERKLRIRYVDAEGELTRRTIWPIALAFFERVRIVVAWCELRQGFRHFRTDRIGVLKLTETRYPRRRQALVKGWRGSEGHPAKIMRDSLLTGIGSALGYLFSHEPWGARVLRRTKGDRSMSKFSFVLLYVDNPLASADFYAGILGRRPIESSPTFAMLPLTDDVMLGLWSKHTVVPTATAPGGNEVAFIVADPKAVRTTFANWKERGLSIAQVPTEMDFGHTFVALDPDGHRLRVYSPVQ